MSTIDIVIPCYNYGRFLEGCVASVLQQSTQQLRLHIIDDASSDDSLSVATKLAERDRRITVTSHPHNRGHIATYNEGIAWASADYFMILSADDMLVPGALERAAGVMDANPDVVLTFGQCIGWHDELPLPTTYPQPSATWARQDLVSDMCEYAGSYSRFQNCSWGCWFRFWGRPYRRIGFCTTSVIVRTQTQKAIGGYRTSLPHTADTEMWMRFATHGAVARIDAVQAIYRWHSSNMSQAYFDRQLSDLQQRKQAFDLFFKEYGDRVPGGRRLHERAVRSLAEKAFWDGIIQLCRGWFVSGRGLLRFSFSLDPSLRYQPPLRRGPAVFADVVGRLVARCTRALVRSRHALSDGLGVRVRPPLTRW